MSHAPVNLRTRRGGKRWFIVTADVPQDTDYPWVDVPVFAQTAEVAGRTVVAALEQAGIPFQRIRSWAATDYSLRWEA